MQINNMMGQSELLKIGYNAQMLKKDAAEFSDLSMSMDSESIRDHGHAGVNEGLMKVPTEAPDVVRTKVAEFESSAQKPSAQNAQLGTKMPPEFSIKAEHNINAMLGRPMPVDTIAAKYEETVVQDEKDEWKKASLADRLRRRHIEAPLPTLSETTVLHNKLANLPAHDFSMPKKKDVHEQTMVAGSALPDADALHIAADHT